MCAKEAENDAVWTGSHTNKSRCDAVTDISTQINKVNANNVDARQSQTGYVHHCDSDEPFLLCRWHMSCLTWPVIWMSPSLRGDDQTPLLARISWPQREHERRARLKLTLQCPPAKIKVLTHRRAEFALEILPRVWLAEDDRQMSAHRDLRRRIPITVLVCKAQLHQRRMSMGKRSPEGRSTQLPDSVSTEVQTE